MGNEAPTPIVIPVHCAPKKAPCSRCGRRGRRKRTPTRTVRAVACEAVAVLEVTCGEYAARRGCCTALRNSPEGAAPKAKYDDRVRALVLDRLLKGGMSIERASASIRREFLLDLSTGFVYDVLRDRAAELDMAARRRMALGRLSGALRVDGLHPGRFTLLLATGPLADLPVAFALVDRNDADHMRRFLGNPRTRGLLPRVVVTDGSDLYPEVLAELWPDADHQLCVLHALETIDGLILGAVRRLKAAMARRGKAGRQKKRGRKGKRARAAAGRRGLALRQKAHFVFKHRHLIAKRREKFTEPDRDDSVQMREYLPELATLRRFADRVYWLSDAPKDVHQAGCRRAAVARGPAFRAVPEVVEAMEQFGAEKSPKPMAYLNGPAGRRVRTNNHVERTDRMFRLLEKVRYKWRRRKTLVRFVVLRLGEVWSHRSSPRAATFKTEPSSGDRKAQADAGKQSRRAA